MRSFKRYLWLIGWRGSSAFRRPQLPLSRSWPASGVPSEGPSRPRALAFNLVEVARKPAKPDRELEEKLKAEWPAILRWMIDGCLDWKRNGLIRPASVTEATEAYFAAQDTFGAWLEEGCDVDPGDGWKSETSANLYAAWSRYAKAAGETAMTRRAFAERMQVTGFDLHRGTGGTRSYKGVRLLPSAHSAESGNAV